MNHFNSIFISNFLSKIFSKNIDQIYINNNIIYCQINKKFLLVFVNFLKNNNNTQFKQVLDIWGVDYLEQENRFLVNYMFISLRFNIRLVLKVKLKENDFLDSITSFYSTAWLEREVWDMFGIFFFSNNDLRRILTDYGFEGYPLRKDYPIMGYTEINYDYESKRLVYTPINLTQEIRTYIYNNPWIDNK